MFFQETIECRILGAALSNTISEEIEYNLGLRKARKLLREYETRRESEFNQRVARGKRDWLKEKRRCEEEKRPVPAPFDKTTIVISQNPKIERLRARLSAGAEIVKSAGNLYAQLVAGLYRQARCISETMRKTRSGAFSTPASRHLSSFLEQLSHHPMPLDLNNLEISLTSLQL